MKFMVNRASDYGVNRKKPCEHAYRSTYVKVDNRTVDDPEKIRFFDGNADNAYDYWYGKGKNHRLINGLIARDIEHEAWFVDIDSLEALMEFQNEFEKIIIRGYYNAHSVKEITIYDDYVE